MNNILRLPSNWGEVSVGMFQELANLDKTKDGLTKVVDLIAILSDTDPEEVKKINASDLDSILEAVKFSHETPSDEYKNEVIIDGETYYLMKLADASIGENADLEAYAADITQLHKFFAVLYRKADEEYSLDTMLKRSELFQEKLSINDVYGTLVFFLSIAKEYEEIIKIYSVAQ